MIEPRFNNKGIAAAGPRLATFALAICLGGFISTDRATIPYPMHERTVTVTECGRKKINLSQVFAGQNVSIRQEDDQIWLVSFMDYDLGYFDLEACRVDPIANPFGPKVLTMSPV